jgi:hypothetical protein
VIFRVATFTEAGGHPVNEDAFEVQRHPADEELWLCTLADGQGGRAGGGLAARVACRTAMEVAGLAPGHKLLTAAYWVKVLREADQAVAKDPKAGFTTLVGFCLGQGQIWGASNGDSAVLAMQADGRAEELTRHQAKNPPIGWGNAACTPFTALLATSRAVLAMTDGVWKYAGWNKIAEAAKGLRGQRLVDSLHSAARLPPSGKLQDDFTLVLFESDAERDLA